jgi:hypothetical protein
VGIIVACAKLADATRAVGILQREADGARADLARASRQIDSAIGAMAMEAGEQLVAELLTAETVARDLRLQLMALAQISHSPVAGQPDRFRLGPRAVRALDRLPLNDDRYPKQGPAHLSPVAPFAHQWQKTIGALRDDPDTPLPLKGLSGITH